MSGSDAPLRVAVVTSKPWGLEGAAINGVIDYMNIAPHWRLVGAEGNPFIAPHDVDQTEFDGAIGFFNIRKRVDSITRQGVPAVNLSNRFADSPMPRVCADDLAAGRMGAEHLMERGFAQFAFVGWSDMWFGEQRLKGFREVIEDAGRPCHVYGERLNDEEPDLVKLRQWIKDLPKPIAVMAANDHLGKYVIDGAAASGLAIPDDVAVIGVDNNHWAMAAAAAPLSSIEPDGRLIGYRAAEMLDGMMAGGRPLPDQFIPPLRVVTRRSTEISLADDTLVSAALRIIRDRCREGIEVEDVLDELAVSRSTLERRMKAAIGLTPRAAIGRAQIEQVKKFLIRSDLTMEQIARTCGFRQQARLNEKFRRLTGLTPGQYRRQRSR